jgi:hypothetical protein
MYPAMAGAEILVNADDLTEATKTLEAAKRAGEV